MPPVKVLAGTDPWMRHDAATATAAHERYRRWRLALVITAAAANVALIAALVAGPHGARMVVFGVSCIAVGWCLNRCGKHLDDRDAAVFTVVAEACVRAATYKRLTCPDPGAHADRAG